MPSDPLPAKPFRTGVALLHDPIRNKGTAFTEEERDRFKLRGLLPPRVCRQEEQCQRILENLRQKPNDLERYIYLVGLQDRNEHLYYRVVMSHIEEIMPLIYTPTVGKACQQFGHVFRRPRGMYVSLEDRGRVKELLSNWPHRDVKVIVVTDGERILGLGDLGAYGMGIPIGKLALYTACAGIHPSSCLPVTLDVGTNNQRILNDPAYLGLARERERGPAYDELIEEFMQAATEMFPGVLIQLEDFGNQNAFRLLNKFRKQVCLFDDDIQGTGAVALSGVYSSLRLSGENLCDQRVLFLGAGEAGLGIGNMVVLAMMDQGLSLEEARQRIWFIDSKGLIVRSRKADLAEHKKTFAHEHAPIRETLEAVKVLKPGILIGVSGRPATFDQPIVEAMAAINARPIIFALSNPTSKAECTAEQAYAWSEGRAIFASGSPFDPVSMYGKRFVPGQGNNVYIFPGVGLGAVVAQTAEVTDEMFFVAAKVLAEQVGEEDLNLGRVYPSLSKIRQVSELIAVAVAEVAYTQNLARVPRPENLAAAVREARFDPEYVEWV